MKWFLLFVLNLTVVANTCVAGFVAKGDIVKLEWKDSFHGANGGEFSLSKKVGNSWVFVAKTFCMEYNEYFTLGESLKVGAVSDRASFGGVNTQIGDILDAKTKFLYDAYSRGTLDDFGLGYQYNNANSADALQNALWSIEGERKLTGSGNDVLAQRLVNYAAANAGAIGSKSVFVLNLFAGNTPDALIAAFDPLKVSTWDKLKKYKKQDQLYFDDSNGSFQSVPEPGSMCVFALGFACAGASKLRASRRRRPSPSPQA